MSLSQTLKHEDIRRIPGVRRLRNALLQEGITKKISELMNPRLQTLFPIVDRKIPEDRRKSPNQVIGTMGKRQDDLRILSIITSITLEDLIKLMEDDMEHSMFIIHERTLEGENNSVKILQKNGYKLSLVADDWRSSGRYIIEKPKNI